MLAHLMLSQWKKPLRQKSPHVRYAQKYYVQVIYLNISILDIKRNKSFYFIFYISQSFVMYIW